MFSCSLSRGHICGFREPISSNPKSNHNLSQFSSVTSACEVDIFIFEIYPVIFIYVKFWPANFRYEIAKMVEQSTEILS